MEQFDPAVERLDDYKERFDFYCVANGIGNDRKKALFLTKIGQRMFANLKVWVSPTSLSDLSFDDIITRLRARTVPQTVEIAERYRFFKCAQKGEESVIDFMSQLRALAKTCNFGNYLEIALRDQFVCGLQDSRIQRELLCVRDLTLEQALDKARSIEIVLKETASLQQRSTNVEGGLNLHLEPNEFQVAIKWWLGMDVSFGSCCPYCPNHRLDPLGHHALTCKHGGDVVLRHNSLRDVFVESCHRACLGGQVEVGSGLGLDRLHFRPADVLVNNWHLGKPAAFDLTVTSPLNPIILTEAGVRCGSSALFAEARKHNANDSKSTTILLASCLAIQMGCSKSQATTTVYQRLSLSLVIANARALLSCARLRQSEEKG
eukprot:Em0021g459a